MIFLQKNCIFAFGYILQLVLLSAHFEDGLWGEDTLCYTKFLKSTHKHTHPENMMKTHAVSV